MSKNRAPRRELLSLVDFAAECGVNPITIRRMIQSGDLPAYRVGRRGILKIDARDVDLVVRRAKPEEVSA